MLQLINNFMQHKANTPPGRELEAEAETAEELFEYLRTENKARQHRLLADDMKAPQVIKDNAKRILSEIDTWVYTLRDDGIVLINDTPPECDFYTIEAK